MVAGPPALRRPRGGRTLPLLLAVAGAAVALLPAPRAEAYVRTRTKGGLPVYWDRAILPITVYTGDPPPRVTSISFLEAARAGAAAWSRRAVRCTAIDLRISSSGVASAPSAADGASRITFRRKEWCREPRKPDDPCYDPSALALTSIFARPSDGKVVDADIEVNAVDFTWTDVERDVDREGDEHDLQNALTHELGHLVGFDHTCILPGALTSSILDDEGGAVPECGDDEGVVEASTMYPSVLPGDAERRTLSDDDLRGLCEVYPAFAPLVEADLSAYGCSIARSRGGRGLPLALAVAGLLALSLRRRGSRARATRSSTRPGPAAPAAAPPDRR